MSKSKINILVLVVLLLAGAVQLLGQTIPPAGSEGKLIAILKSDASHKEKADACRQLSIIGTKDAVAPLAALLGDEKLSHMARYALEPIPDLQERGRIDFVEIQSQVGSECRLRNPWPDAALTLYRNGKKAEDLSGSLLAFPGRAAKPSPWFARVQCLSLPKFPYLLCHRDLCKMVFSRETRGAMYI